MKTDRRNFFKIIAAASLGQLAGSNALAVGEKSKFHFAQLVYFGGNWLPRPTALRRLAWEVHKRTAISCSLEPLEIKPSLNELSVCPFIYMAGDRAFSDFTSKYKKALLRFFSLGGTMLVDPAFDKKKDTNGFNKSFDRLISSILPGVKENIIPSEHVLMRTFYKINRPYGRIIGPEHLTSYSFDSRLAVVRSRHDLGGAWAKDNIGNWMFDPIPGGEHQREDAFKIGINLVMYALLLDYKNETPHKRFNRIDI